MPKPLAIVSLSGDIDIYTVEETRQKLSAINGPAVINLADVTFVTSAGLSALADVARRVGCGKIRLVNARPNVYRILNGVQFGSLFEIAAIRNKPW